MGRLKAAALIRIEIQLVYSPVILIVLFFPDVFVNHLFITTPG